MSLADPPGLPGVDGGVVREMSDALRSLSRAAPVHAILVHYTIALTSTSLLLELLGRVLGQPGLALAGWWTLALAALATIGTVATGVVSRLSVDVGEGTARSYLRLHMALGPGFLGMLLATTAWRAVLWSAERTPGWWYLAALAATSLVMAVQGFVGGELVYRWGVDVDGRARGLRQRARHVDPPRWTAARVEEAGTVAR